MNFKFNPYAVLNGVGEITIKQKTDGAVTSFTAKNSGEAVTVGEIVLVDTENPFPKTACVYGEGYSMLAQYNGTVEKLGKVGYFDDTVHYKLPKKEGFNVVFNMAVFEHEGVHTVIGFSSCNRFCGEIRFNAERLQVVLNIENKAFYNGETALEELYIASSENREELLSDFAEKIEKNHPKLPLKEAPSGWCSWYCFGPHVTENDILNNLDSINELGLNLRYVQIDDGYQSKMGDWLIPAESFPNGMKPLFDKIIEKGFEPAIWVAPFIAEKDSVILKEHPDWFIKNDDGEPLAADTFTFGGWRRAPWYMLDPTNPECYEHIKNTFSYMRNEWNCRYFKLDANMWGAFPNGVRFDNDATAAQSYKLGMKAMLEGAGEDCFLLGCNAPMWPSIGAVHGNRQTGDISRHFGVFKQLADECFYRNWQNNRFWINDPDCVTVENRYIALSDAGGRVAKVSDDLTDDEFLFHATYIFASGGIVLSGDDLSSDSLERLDVLKYLLDAEHVAAKFDDTSFAVGRKDCGEKKFLCLFNRESEKKEFNVEIGGKYSAYDVWHKKELGESEDVFTFTMNPRSGVVIELR